MTELDEAPGEPAGTAAELSEADVRRVLETRSGLDPSDISEEAVRAATTHGMFFLRIATRLAWSHAQSEQRTTIEPQDITAAARQITEQWDDIRAVIRARREILCDFSRVEQAEMNTP